MAPQVAEAIATLSTKTNGSEPATDDVRLSVWPNPAAGAATVVLTLADAAEANVTVYDVRGRRVAVLHEGPLEAGAHRLGMGTTVLPAGTYLVRAWVGAAVLTQTLTVLR